eukprot:7344685-Heterocapsa_arctica.AAC.1
MRRVAAANKNEKGKTNNTKAKEINKNKATKNKPAKVEENTDGDIIEAITLEEWWEKTQATVLAALAREEEVQKARDQLL